MGARVAAASWMLWLLASTSITKISVDKHSTLLHLVSFQQGHASTVCCCCV